MPSAGPSPARSMPAAEDPTSDDLLDVSDILPELSYKCLVPKCQKIIQVGQIYLVKLPFLLGLLIWIGLDKL